jgi:hypothetical protein
MTTDTRSMAGPPPPLDSTPTMPPSGKALDRLKAWSDQQVEGLHAWLAVPAARLDPLAGPTLPPVPHRPMFGPPRPLDRWARLRITARARRRALAHTERSRWAAQVPRWTARTEPTTNARALAVALDLYRPPRDSNRLAWRTRTGGNGPCRLTVAQPTLAQVGAVPKPVAWLDHLDRRDWPADVLPSGGSCWLTNDGRVTDAVVVDVDGNPHDSRGGRGKASDRPSTVPATARKTDHKVKVNRPGEAERQRVWAWLDRFGQVQARTMSGHDVHLSTRGRSALAGWLAPRSSESV